ncbi:MAG: CLI_3235 family bacteriocin precursor [Lachnospiraceae bacterium]|nr:CLI_3235 family bacteriocin precursor [Lachnospiraceae bacterium]
MKNLNKKRNVPNNTVEAYALGCSCTCVCYCIKIGKLNLYASSYGDNSASITMTPWAS